MAEENEQSRIVPDPEIDSAFEVSLEEPSLTSLRTSILDHQHENGRTYHSMSAGKYNYPNDDSEAERYDLQHQIWLMTFDGKLACNPGTETAKRVMDMGTGTGIWAIDYADAYPAAEVIGVDLSPIQPSFVPPNCSFEIDDLEKEWTWSKPFDMIISRAMAGAFADPVSIFQKAYDNLTPGGWFEIQDLELPMGCDDDTVTKESAVWRWHQSLYEASKLVGRPLDSASKFGPELEKIGFTNAGHEEYKWPFNSWPKEKKHKDIGRWHCANLDMGIEAFSLALLTRVLGWSKEEALLLCAEVRKDIRNPKMHGYWKIHVIYGQKPLAKTTESDE